MSKEICPDCIPGTTPHTVSPQCVYVLLSSNRLLTEKLAAAEARVNDLETELREIKLGMGDDFGDSIPAVVKALKAENAKLREALEMALKFMGDPEQRNNPHKAMALTWKISDALGITS